MGESKEAHGVHDSSSVAWAFSMKGYEELRGSIVSQDGPNSETPKSG